MMDELTPTSFAKLVDHTVLAPTATEQDVQKICAEALQYGTASVCVNPSWIPTVAAALADSDVLSCSVAGFPLGADQPEPVAVTVRVAVEEGADEIDVVLPIGRLIDGDLGFVDDYLGNVRAACSGATLKVIIESATLSEAQIVTACERSMAAAADFVKTSTGFHASGGASPSAVALMRQTVGPDIGVKASGGIRSLSDVHAMLAAGASRLGMSATAAIIGELS